VKEGSGGERKRRTEGSEGTDAQERRTDVQEGSEGRKEGRKEGRGKRANRPRAEKKKTNPVGQ
jgi:hypothetical protein